MRSRLHCSLATAAIVVALAGTANATPDPNAEAPRLANDAWLRTGRFALGTVSGAALGVATSAAVYSIWCGIETEQQPRAFLQCLNPLVIGAPLGFFAGVVAAPMLTGYLLDGEGNLFATAGGALAGMAVGAAWYLGVQQLSGRILLSRGQLTEASAIQYLALGGAILASSAGAALGYEFTSPLRRSRAGAEDDARLNAMVVPVLLSGGAGFAASGSF